MEKSRNYEYNEVHVFKDANTFISSVETCLTWYNNLLGMTRAVNNRQVKNELLRTLDVRER